MPGVQLGLARIGAWTALASRLSGFGVNLLKKESRIIKEAAERLEKAVKLGLITGAPGGKRFTPLAVSTVVQRDGDISPLVDTGALMRSIGHSVRITGGSGPEAFVGVNKTARGHNGLSMIEIAEIHEQGVGPFTIAVTDGMRRFFRWLAIASGGQIRPLSALTTTINHPGIPARPFIRPVWEKIGPDIQRVIAKNMSPPNGPL